MRGRPNTAAPWLLSASLLLVPSSLVADEDLPAKRELCQTEARERIKARRGNGPDLYEITTRARQSYIRECMARAPEDWLTTGSVGTKPVPPLPPPRPRDAVKL